MKILKQANKFAVNNLPMQRKEEGREYILSKYVIREGNSFHNSLTNEDILVEDFEKDRDVLISRWYYTPSDEDVSGIAYFLRQRNLLINSGPGSSKKNGYVIFTTTGCNASCGYCFEKGCKTLTMSEQTAKDVVDYISVSASKPDVKIKWFGGEPLLNRKAISIILEGLKKKGIAYRTEISTNGDLFPDYSDEEILSWNLLTVQFTVDDIGANYDRVKGLPSGAYERLRRTVDRLSKLLPKSRINIRIHYNPEKGSDVCYKVINDFKGFGNNVKVYARLLYNNATLENFKELLKIEDYIIDEGLHSIFEFTFNYGPHCMSDNYQIACITPNGELTPCEHYVYGEHIYGSIYNREKNWNILNKWSEREKYSDPKCKECPLYPSCRKLTMCPAEGKCSEGYQYYQIETIKRALRKKAEELR